MSGKRFVEIFRQEFTRTIKSPSFIIFILVLLFVSFGLTSGNVRISSGSTVVGGTKVLITSEYSIAFIISLLSFILYSFFITTSAGMTLIRDRECKVEEIIHTTALTPMEYIAGKYMAVLVVFTGALLLQCGMFMVFHHVIPNTATVDIVGPFSLTNYLRPFILFCFPTIVFFSGVAFFIGEYSRKPAAVYLFPALILILDVFFFINWSPEWLSQFWNNVMILLEPAGFRWLDEICLKVDKGAEFYNTQPVGYDTLFLLNRLLILLMGLIPVCLSYFHFVRKLRASDNSQTQSKSAKRMQSVSPLATPVPASFVSQASEIKVTSTRSTPGFFTATLHIVRSELQELRNHAGLYLFIPIFTLFILGDVFTAIGLFDTPMLVTSGVIAVKTLPSLTVLGVLFLMFYVVEALMREDITGIAPMTKSSPVSTYSILTGKMLAILMLGFLIMFASFVSAMIGILLQGSVPINPFPFLLVWGIVLVPTYLVWISFITLVFSFVQNRYVTYAIGLGIFMGFGILQILGKVNWVGNWVLWRALSWSDISILEIDRSAIILNRVLYLTITMLCIVLAGKLYQRTTRDAARTFHRLQPQRLLRDNYKLLPLILIPFILGCMLYSDVRSGRGGSLYEKSAKDYWKQNVKTFLNYPKPGITNVHLKVEITPDSSQVHTIGRYDLINHHEHKLHKILFTGDLAWENVSWKLNGEEVEPENRSGLYVFEQKPPLQPGETLSVEFELTNTVPLGISKNGGGDSEFILPSGIVLTSFTPSFAPLPGFFEEVGITEDNLADPKEFEPDFHVGRTEPFVGAASSFTSHIEVTVPASMRANSVGVLTNTIDNGETKTWVWDSDYPIRFFNIVAGEFEVWQGEGTAIYYNHQHPYNVEMIGKALDGARKYYSQWFTPFPWQELRITEFPGIAYYAQGFPSNISFSEQVGFLVKDEKEGNAAFTVAAHESAHQWWANILTPGEGPGGNVLSEGMAHFSTAMLIEEILGKAAYAEFLTRIEGFYGKDRSVDNEKPLAWVDGSRPGDTTVMYDKGGWTFLMMKQLMGNDDFLAGIRGFIDAYRFGPDYPMIQDFTAFMRDYAPDVDAYDVFVDQWFYSVIVPEFELANIQIKTADPSMELMNTPDIDHEPSTDDMSANDLFFDDTVDNETPDNEILANDVLVSGTPAEETPVTVVSDDNGPHWVITGELTNIGSGVVSVDIGALRGEKFRKPSEDDLHTEDTKNVPYEIARTTVMLGPDETREFTIRSEFQPDRVVVDPDLHLLQLNRKSAMEKL